jgi:hypothetical protein
LAIDKRSYSIEPDISVTTTTTTKPLSLHRLSLLNDDHPKFNKSRSRLKKRSLFTAYSKPVAKKTMNLLVVADRSMLDHYNNEMNSFIDLENYLTTIIDFVALIYRDTFLETSISIVLKRLEIFENDVKLKLKLKSKFFC